MRRAANVAADRAALIAQLKQYDTRNHRGKYAVLMRKAVVALESDAALREEIARLTHNGYCPNCGGYMRPATAEAQLRAVPLGTVPRQRCRTCGAPPEVGPDVAELRAVPREPTEAMIDAGHIYSDMTREGVTKIWRAMFDAAPGPSAPQDQSARIVIEMCDHNRAMYQSCDGCGRDEQPQGTLTTSASTPGTDVARPSQEGGAGSDADLLVDAIICPVRGHTCWGPHKADMKHCCQDQPASAASGSGAHPNAGVASQSDADLCASLLADCRADAERWKAECMNARKAREASKGAA